MKCKGIVLFLLLYSVCGWSQSMTTDILTDMHIIVEEPTPDSVSNVSVDTQLPDSSTVSLQQEAGVYYWSDVRYMRDSLKLAMRIVRDSMRMDIREMRDSVRNDLQNLSDQRPHELRIGWGDQLFETLMWYNKPYYTLYPEAFIGEYEENYRYTQHWFLEYQYRIKYWFNFGALVDYSGVIWDKVMRNGKGEELNREENRHFHNIAVLLTLRFTYLHSKYVSMYSGLGAGLNINTGSETDFWGRQTVMAPALNFTVLGLSVGNEQWFGALEFGGLYSLMSSNEIYLAGSRMFTASVGVKL